MTTLNGRYNGLALVEYFAGVLLWLLSYIPRAWAMLLVHTLWQDSQRSEYYADALAARVSGTQSMLGLLDKLHLAHILAGAIQIGSGESGQSRRLCGVCPPHRGAARPREGTSATGGAATGIAVGQHAPTDGIPYREPSSPVGPCAGTDSRPC